jgi:hypothetical protein
MPTSGALQAAVGRFSVTPGRATLLSLRVFDARFHPAMIELNPIRQRIADLQDRLLSLRGYL